MSSITPPSVGLLQALAEIDDLRSRADDLGKALHDAKADGARKDKLIEQLSFRIKEMETRLHASMDDARRNRQRSEALESEAARTKADLQRRLDWESQQVSALQEQIETALHQQQGLRSELNSVSRSLNGSVRLLLLSGEQRARAQRVRRGLGILRRAPWDIQGHVDQIANGTISGWIRDMRRPNKPLRLQARFGDRVLGTTIASVFRSDLAALGYGTGHHGFELRLLTDGAKGLDGQVGQITIETVEEPPFYLAIFDLPQDQDARTLLIGRD